ncbi:MAG: methyltransferase domain-containing protein [Proteobacteria bacterium]|nr:methyltransferase domain-containing protein [Pseudomonadota bacterium]
MSITNSPKQLKNVPKKKPKAKAPSDQAQRTLGPISDLERHLPPEWWKTLFNSLYLKTDGDVVENNLNTENDVNILIKETGIKPEDRLLDLCCGQGRHSLELAKRGYRFVTGVDRSRYLIRLARKRAKTLGMSVTFSEGDARHFRLKDSSIDCAFMMGNSFGYFEREEDDIAVLNNLKRILTSSGMLLLDIVDGTWMSQHFEPRSWEWIDQNHFVNRERSLSSDGKRIISREVITNAEIGVMADQLYAERLYSLDEITAILSDLKFTDIQNHGNVYSHSTRGQDLGMMANRLFITARAPQKQKTITTTLSKLQTTVIMGDPTLPDVVKKNGQFNNEDFETINQLKQNLKLLDDFQFTYLDNHKSLIQQLIKSPPAFVFNLCDEGFNNKAAEELHIPALLEMLKVPYTGAGPTCLALCYNKSFVRSVAASIDVPVPLETYYTPSDQAAHIPHTFPAIIKPNCGDSSIGITQHAVVQNAEELIDYINYLNELLPGVPLLIQEYLDGPEYTVGLIGNPGKFEALPLLEVDFSHLPENLPKILSYESKWLPDSPYWNQIKYKEAELGDDVARKLIDYSQALFERLECRDYARFDFRADSQGNIKLLEVNPNPGWCWDGKFNLMAKIANMSYLQLLEQILKVARERLGLG